jgi:hypothetical protein
MKNFVAMMAVVVFTFGFIACDEAKELGKVSIQNTWKKSFDITSQEVKETLNFNDSFTLNIREEDESLKPFLDRLEKFTVHEVNLYIVDFLGEDNATFNGSFAFAKEGDTEPLLLSSFENIVLSEYTDSDSPIKLTLNADQKEALEKALKDEDELIISLDGTLTNTPVSFTLKVVIEAQTQYSAFK